jgi:hypothetical protein
VGKSFGKNAMASNPIASQATRDSRTVLARDQVQDFDDPDIPDRHLEEGTVCSRCGAVYHNQHWVFDEKRREMLLAAGTGKQVVCPGCKIVAERNPQGIVTLSGDYWPQHREDILNLIRNEEARGTNTNPLERIIDIREESGSLIIETTNEKLAQRIGRSVHRAHKGEVDYRWSGDNNLVRVYWERAA